MIVRPEGATEVEATAVLSAASSAASENGARMASSPKVTIVMKLEAYKRLQISQPSIL